MEIICVVAQNALAQICARENGSEEQDGREIRFVQPKMGRSLDSEPGQRRCSGSSTGEAPTTSSSQLSGRSRHTV